MEGADHHQSHETVGIFRKAFSALPGGDETISTLYFLTTSMNYVNDLT